MSENLRLILDFVALGAVLWAFLKGLFGVQTTVKQHTEWIEAHELCNEKQIEILNELRRHFAYIKGKLGEDDDD